MCWRKIKIPSFLSWSKIRCIILFFSENFCNFKKFPFYACPEKILRKKSNLYKKLFQFKERKLIKQVGPKVFANYPLRWILQQGVLPFNLMTSFSGFIRKIYCWVFRKEKKKNPITLLKMFIFLTVENVCIYYIFLGIPVFWNVCY